MIRHRNITRQGKVFHARGERLEDRLALAGDFAGVITLGGTSFDSVKSAAVDAAGNQYVAGEFQGTASFGSVQLTSAGDNDAYVAKYDPGGSLLWARRIGNRGVDRLNTLAVGDNGHVHIGGYFAGTVDFDPGTGTHEVDSIGARDGYVLTLDGSGNFVQVFQIGGNSAVDVLDIELGPSGMFLAGSFGRHTDFDPGPGDMILTSAGSLDAFLAHYSYSGELQWVRQLGGLQQDVAERVKLNAAGDLILAGNYRSENTDFDPGPGETILPHGGAYDMFISRWDTAGNQQWIVGVGGTDSDTIADLALDSAGNVFTTGTFFQTVDFDPGPGGASLAAGETSAAFVWKLDSAGEFEWVKEYDGSIFDSGSGWAIAVDNNDQVFAAGSIYGTLFFDGSPVTTAGASDAYLAKLDNATGDIEYLRQFGGIRDDLPFSIATDAQGSIYTGGYFQLRTDFDPGDGTQNRDSVGSADGFLLRLLDEPPIGTSVMGRHVFYNDSAFDGNDPAANAADDGAIAPDKTALLPGQIASFANYTSYSHGLNGIMIDVANLANPAGLSADDFLFRAGNSQNTGSWVATPTPMEVSVRPGAGTLGSDRITILFANDSITRQWLQVTMLATPDTGLAMADVFYFGNAIGETGNSGDTLVDATDFLATRAANNNFLNPADRLSTVDFNRDTLVDAGDLLVLRDHATSLASALVLLEAPQMINKQAVVITESDLQPASRNKLPRQDDRLTPESEAESDAIAIDAYFAEYGSTK